MRLLQLGDSALPVGAFSFSNGLESAVQAKVVRDAKGLEDFVRAASRTSATTDGVALLVAFRAARAGDRPLVARADREAFDRKLNEEMRLMSVRMGRKLAEVAVTIAEAPGVQAWLEEIRRGRTPGTYPVAQALAFEALGLDESSAFAAHQYGVAAMMVNASMRLMRIGHMDAQAILRRIGDEAPAAYEEARGRSLSDMASFSPQVDILAAAHVRATVRLFMN
ncbi:urease accessory protein UreF [Aquisphaera insulae]|uniref:urease accessory protein UreF n=1 Tax=Aquisphaera insulae TaxID=2712864 RepID=UPI003F6FC073